MQNPSACEEMCKKGVSDSCKYARSYAVYVPGTTLYTMLPCILCTEYIMCMGMRHTV